MNSCSRPVFFCIIEIFIEIVQKAWRTGRELNIAVAVFLYQCRFTWVTLFNVHFVSFYLFLFQDLESIRALLTFVASFHLQLFTVELLVHMLLGTLLISTLRIWWQGKSEILISDPIINCNWRPTRTVVVPGHCALYTGSTVPHQASAPGIAH